jgi:hypothetical protein
MYEARFGISSNYLDKVQHIQHVLTGPAAYPDRTGHPAYLDKY